jgi:hypothetical protein
MTMTTPRRLLLIPALDEAETLHRVLDTIPADFDADVVIIDGGQNGSRARAPERTDLLKVAIGNGRAVRAGLRYALDRDYTQIFRIDAGGQHDPGYLPAAADALRPGRFVIGSRYHPDSPIVSEPPLDRELLTLGTCHLINTLTGLALTDPISGFWGLDAELARRVCGSLTTTGYGITLEVVLRLSGSAVITEIPHPRIYTGSTKLNTKYADRELPSRAQRAADYLTVIASTAAALARSGALR